MAHAPQHPGGNGAANFIRQIVSDPKNVPDVTLLTGYLGASSEEGHERLYLSTDLANYVEIPKAAILHQAPLPKEQDPHGGVTLWVKKDAALQYKMAPAAQALANYFAGAIQAGAQGAAPVARPIPATLGGPVCGVTLPNICQVVSAACTFDTCGFDCSVVCPTQQVTCPAGCGVDSFVLCPTHRLPCPTHPPQATCLPNCTHATPCLLTAPSPCAEASCGIACTVVGPACGSRFHTCAPCVTQNRTPCPAVSCGIDCTVVGPACQSIHVGTCFVQCNPTRFQPQCPFPTEVTCAPVCHQTFAQPCVASPAPACGPNTIGGCSAACFPGQPGPVAQAAFAGQAAFGGQANLRAQHSVLAPCFSVFAPCRTPHPLQCTIGCTQPPNCVFETVNPQCATRFIHCTQAPVCLVSAFGTCNVIQCAVLPTHPPCVQVSVPPILCLPDGPGQPPPGGPVEQRQAFSLANCSNCSVAFCTQVPVVCNPTQVTPCVM